MIGTIPGSPNDIGKIFTETTMKRWRKCSDELPPTDLVVHTKIDDGKGCRNETKLKRYQSAPGKASLWFFPDSSMYVYYTPTHWALIEDEA